MSTDIVCGSHGNFFAYPLSDVTETLDRKLNLTVQPVSICSLSVNVETVSDSLCNTEMQRIFYSRVREGEGAAAGENPKEMKHQQRKQRANRFTRSPVRPQSGGWVGRLILMVAVMIE